MTDLETIKKILDILNDTITKLHILLSEIKEPEDRVDAYRVSLSKKTQ